MPERLLAIAGMIRADSNASTRPAESLFTLLLEVAGDRSGRDALTRLSAEPPALALDDLTHGFVDEPTGPILDQQIMAIASRVLVALDPARFEMPSYRSAEEALSRYNLELKSQQRELRFAAQEGKPSAFWDRQLTKKAEAVRSARAAWRAAVERAIGTGESPSSPDFKQREAQAISAGEEALELLTRRYGRGAGFQVRVVAVADDDGCTPWSELVHQAALAVLGAQFEAERWQSMAAMDRERESG
jgi:hypothetical protein